jgi:hypothetical protein
MLPVEAVNHDWKIRNHVGNQRALYPPQIIVELGDEEQAKIDEFANVPALAPKICGDERVDVVADLRVDAVD